MYKCVSAGPALLHANFTPYRSFLDILHDFSGNRSKIEIERKKASMPGGGRRIVIIPRNNGQRDY
jgi:hypothetical protein